MIVPMIKYDFILHNAELPAFLEKLQELGIVDTEVYCFDCSSYIYGTVTKTDCQKYINSPIPVEPNIAVQYLLNRHPRIMPKGSAS